MAEVRAVLFDYGLVLSGPPDPAAWERMKEALRMEEKSFHAAYWLHRHDYDRGVLNSGAYWCSVAGRSLGAAELRQLESDDTVLWTQPNQPMIDWALRLQRAGVKTGVLSNIGDAMEAGVRAQCTWMSGFAHYTYSHTLGIAKPELAIYRHAADGLQTEAEAILFIDDREDNIAAAAEVGMQTVQYTDHETFLRSMQEKGLEHLLLV